MAARRLLRQYAHILCVLAYIDSLLMMKERKKDLRPLPGVR
jgi:hypothetical protein